MVAAAALDCGEVLDSHYECPTVYDSRDPDGFKCSTRGLHREEPLDLRRALQQSCNCYFYRLGERLGSDRLRQAARAYGFGQSTGIDLPEFSHGLLPHGNVRNNAIGQGKISTSPLQLVRYVAAIAVGSEFPVPHFVIPRDRPPVPPPFRSPGTAKFLREAMARAVHPPYGDRGTVSNAILGLNVFAAGIKTGTAQYLWKKELKTRSVVAWITGFAPVERPEMAFVVCLEDVHYVKGGAARIAGPVARKILDYFATRSERFLYKEGSR